MTSRPKPITAPGYRLGYRPDIEGLRAVAIALVVAAHAGVPGLQGGFVGVDLFFVLSGYLITGLLAQEIHASGRVRLLDFYARRLRRLLPAPCWSCWSAAVFWQPRCWRRSSRFPRRGRLRLPRCG